jgi:hypothetical protein
VHLVGIYSLLSSLIQGTMNLKKKLPCMYLNIPVVPHTKHKKQLVKAVQGNSRWLYGGTKVHRNTPHEQNVERLNFQSGNTLAFCNATTGL